MIAWYYSTMVTWYPGPMAQLAWQSVWPCLRAIETGLDVHGTERKYHDLAWHAASLELCVKCA